MSVICIITLIVWLISAVGMVILVLLHSGKGTGMSDMIASSVSNSFSGTTTMEKNLDRLTVIAAVLFFVSLLVLMIVYPQGTISAQ